MIITWSSGEADYGMPEVLIDLMDKISCHPWWQARAKIVLSLLKKMKIHPPASVLDVGCGWGVNLEALERQGYRFVGLDNYRSSQETLDRPRRKLIEADITKTIFANAEQYDAVIALDVIEHLDNDRAAVAKLAKLTKPGGITIVSVPALPSLFSEFDAVQGHRRRYLPHTLREAFVSTDLIVEQILWWGSWLVPLLRRQRRQSPPLMNKSPLATYRSYLLLPPWPFSLVLRLAFALDQTRTLRGKVRNGTSLFAVAHRPS